jgi:peptidoglycan/LPS O-acetylase OafA/YrhL
MVFVAHAGAGSFVPGGFGVTVFFFLSGYLITTLLRGEAIKKGTISLKDFYLRRAFRILPPLYLTLALAFLIGFMGWLPDRGDWKGLVAALLYASNYYDLIKHFSSLPSGMELIWSLAVEEHFYFIFPLAFAWFVRRRFSVNLQTKLFASACSVALLWRCVLIFVVHIRVDRPDIWTYNSTDCRFDALLFGCLLAIRNNPWFSDPSPVLEKFKGGLALLGIAAIGLSLAIRNPDYRETLRYTQQSVALYPIFYFCVASPTSLVVRCLEWRPLRWIGWVSYTVYLSHRALLSYFSHNGFPNQPWKSGAAALICALLYGWFMRVAVESPARAWRDRVIGGKKKPLAAVP